LVAPTSALAQIAFVQGNYAVPQSPQATVIVPYNAAQGAGNLNVILIGWNDSTATVTSVVDSRGNAYTMGVAPTVLAGKASHAIYYARNIVAAGAGVNLVTVQFSAAASYPDVRVLEYRGLDTVNPFVGGVGASGTSNTSNSGSLTTTTAPGTLLVAGNVVEKTTRGAGANFTSRTITNPNGDIAEDRILTAAGTYGATATLVSGYWVMQMAAFVAPSADTTPPTATITAPASGATVSGSMTVTATASDNAAVAGVQFKLDGANLGAEVTTSPYSVTWNTGSVVNGSHTLTAVVRDTANLTSTSAPVTVTVSNDTIPPAVTITAPAANVTLNGSVVVTADASDNVSMAGVQFKLDGGNLGAEVTSAPYTLVWNTTLTLNGLHSLTAVARDVSNLTATSAAVPVTVNNPDSTPPTVAITAPVAGTTVSGSVTAAATASDNVAVVGVQFKLDGADLGVEFSTPPYSLTWNTTAVTNGAHTLTAVARDTANLVTTSAPVTVTVSNDTTPPTVTLTTPVSGATVSGNVTVTASASDNMSVAGVQFKLDGTNLGAELTSAPYSLTWNSASVVNGVHTLTAVAHDTANLTTTSAPVSVTVSNAGTATIAFVQSAYAVPQTPVSTVAVAFPAAQTSGNLNVVVVGWNDSTATVTSVTDSRSNSYALAAAPTVMAGKASQAIYYARNIAPAGAGANSVTIQFSAAAVYADVRILEYKGLDTVSPLLGSVGASGTSASSSSGTLTTTVANALLVAANVVQTSTTGPGAGFTSRLVTNPNGDIVEDRIVTAAGAYSATAPLASSGYWVTQLVAFAAGTLGPPPPDTTPPAVSITAPAAGATISGAVTVAATATDNVAVAGVQFQLDGANLGAEVTSAPYSLSWNTAGVVAGAHTLTAVARDTSNLTTTSLPVAITVTSDTTPPSVTITAPASGATLSGTVTVTASASDNIGVAGVQFRLDGANLGGEIASSPYSLAWSTTGVANGAHTLTAAARDTSNLTTVSAAVPITVSNSGGSANIRFVQANYAVPQTPQSTVAVTFPAAQSTGNLNVVVVGWADSTTSVTSVADSRGNLYALAVGPTRLSGSSSQSIYYARNIAASAAGSNVVTVRFNVAATFPDIRVLEYAGLDVTNPLMSTAAATGTSSLSSSGSLTTTVPNALLVAANIVQTTTTGAGSGFTSRMITTPNGDIVEDRIVASAGVYSASAPLQIGKWVMQLVAFAAPGGAADTGPPTVTVTAPAAGASLAGTVTLAAAASDDVAVAGVQFKVDGISVGAEVTTTPYFVAWNTTTVADGTHVVTAVARDPAGNTTTSSPVSITVSNATASATSRIGQWSASSSWPIVAIHTALLPNGRILAWDGAAQSGAARVWNPSTNAFTTVNPPDNIFCAGFSLLPDGRLFVAGGHLNANYIGIPDANFFDSVNQTWSSAPPMSVGRWYPTATVLPDRRVLVVSGAIDCEACIAQTPEIYNPATNKWTLLPSANLELPIYPHLFVLPDGRVLATSAFEGTSVAVALDLATGTWSVIDGGVTDGHSAAMYQAGKVLKSGTSANSDPPYTPSQGTTLVLDMTQSSPAWRQTPPMAFPRAYHNLTLLPDGSVLATGGNKTTDTFDETQAVLAAELWSPVTETWTTLASMSVPRVYHSTGLLLPDGRVLVTGGGRFGNPTGDYHDKLNAQIYSPPYLFKGARPTISSVTNAVTYGSTFSVVTPDASRVASVAFMRVGAVTHGFNQSQSYVPLAFTVVGGALNVQAPASATAAVPGYYLLFIVDNNGVPSVAPIVQLQ
jgi:hypothetical protein